MGLTSLPVLNKLGYRNYWQNFWTNNKLYSRTLLSTVLVETLTLTLNSEKAISIKFGQSHNVQNYFAAEWRNIVVYWFQKNIFNGEVWFFQYQNWIVITPLYFRLHNFLSKPKTNKTNIFELCSIIRAVDMNFFIEQLLIEDEPVIEQEEVLNNLDTIQVIKAPDVSLEIVLNTTNKPEVLSTNVVDSLKII